MSASSVGFGWIEVLLILLGGGGLVGTPPGERDPSFLKTAPPQSLMYVEWASRGPGKAGAPGIDGFVADPEIQALVSAIDKALAPTAPTGSDESLPQVSQRDSIRLAQLVTAHSGCLFAVADPVPPRGLLNVLSPLDSLAQLHVCLVVNAGADATAIIDAFNRATQNEVPPQPRMHTVAGPKGTRLTLHQDGNRLLLGFGAGTIERAMAGLRGQTPGLDTNPRFAAGLKRVATGRLGSIAWFDLKSSADATVQSLGPAGLVVQTILRGAGADALDFIVSGTGVADGNVVQRTFIATGGRTDGVLMLARNPALRPEQFSHIPADSDVVLATSLDLAQIVMGIRDLLAKTNPLTVKVFDEAIRELETELGLSLGQDVFPAFGNAWTAFNSPSEGGLIGSSLIAAVEVRDPAKAQVIFDRLMSLVEQSVTTETDTEFGVTAELRRHEFMGHTISYVNRSGGNLGAATSMTPSFCMTHGHLLFSIHPQAIKAHLRYMSQPRPGFDATNKLSLGREELLTATYLDGVRATQTLSAVMPFLSQTIGEIASMNGWELDSFMIPSSAALVPYAGDVTTSIARQRDGLLFESRNPQIALALVAAVGSVRPWFHADFEMLMEAKRQHLQPVQNAGLGAAEGQVVPAAAVRPEEAPREKPSDAVARRLTPLMLKALVPDGIQPLIPEDVFRKLAEPPSPEALQQREERRKMMEERRLERIQRRRGPLPVPPPPPQQ